MQQFIDMSATIPAEKPTEPGAQIREADETAEAAPEETVPAPTEEPVDRFITLSTCSYEFNEPDLSLWAC